MIGFLQFMTPERTIALFCVLMVPAIGLASILAGHGIIGVATGLSAAFAAVALFSLKAESPSKPLLGLALMAQPIALTAALTGHPWQLDSHMAFFAFLAMLVSLRDVTTILVATVAVALHHLALTFFLPSLVYPSTALAENFPRTLFHAIILLIETGALILSIRVINRLFSENQARVANLASLQAEAEQARDEALTAQKVAEESQQTAEKARQSAEKALSDMQEQEREAELATRRSLEAEAAKNAAAEKHQADLQDVINALGNGLKALADKKLDVHLSTPFPGEYDNLRQSLNATAQALHTALKQVAGETHSMQSASACIESELRQLSDRSRKHLAEVERATLDMQSVAAGVHEAADSAAKMKKDVLSARDSAERSGIVVERASTAMTEIDNSAKEISTIISVIEQIAFQTNLLALNAGVEAARAGDAGRGFAVVASEVRALAQRSSEAARDISALITNSQEQVQTGVKFVAETVETLNAVKNAVLQVSDQVQDLSASATEQAEAIGGISTSFLGIENDTRRNAESMDANAKAAADLTTVASGVMSLAKEFVQDENNEAAAA